MPMPFHVDLLGPVEVRASDAAVPLGRRERAVVALLALHVGSVVPVTRIIDELWPDGSPDTASNIVQGVVSRLRRSLGSDAVTTAGAGYRLDRSRVTIDLEEFERFAGAGRSALAERPVEAAERLRQALALWKGEPLSDLQDLPFAQMEAVRLLERRMLVVEDRIAADLATGAGPSILDELADLERRHPFREGLMATRMRALAQAGRRVEALDAYSAFRRRLVDETGLEPTAALRALHQSLLDDDAESPQPAKAVTPAMPSQAGMSSDQIGKPRVPTGTVTLLFSDIEGSTALLSRLGPTYADALDGQRRILRRVWAAHGGVELGTEGDSFYVVFATAPDAVAAAVQAQRELAGFEWPAGEQVRVRMGIHTGAPTPHDGAYVGIDVHRAARVAGAAHGGQVLISQATESLVKECLPLGVAVKDLGSHQLKDIPSPERMFQLTIDGLIADFPPPKSLGTSSSLPRPPTPLVGREDELAGLAAVLTSPEVRLVTLTGPGGTGKTRLGIAVAELTRDRFPDGVYFVPLAAVTRTDVMWTTIAEVLDVPPEGRIPPALFNHVAHRSGLLVLDNLEQLNGADDVVAELMTAAPKVVVLATSRRPLHVPGEHERPVPPLELPQQGDFEAAPGTGAVRLFVQQAQMVLPKFRLTADNTADVVAVCTRLDGLPLAIELAAARSKMLTPRALLARLTDALGIAATGRWGPRRQQTLRDTIGWSYDLLDPEQQGFFRRLGVFAGGADLDAISVVIQPVSGQGELDPFDLVADLVDASLITITETAVGEPRVAMLETIRSYAVEALHAAGEAESVRDRHAQHYLEVARQLGPQLNGMEPLEARRRLETEHDNLREALARLLQTEPTGKDSTGRRPSLELCALLAPFWFNGGYLVEGRAWLEQVTAQHEQADSADLAACLSFLAQTLFELGHVEPGDRVNQRSVAIYRRLNEHNGLASALIILAWTKMHYGDIAAARAVFEEAADVAREATDNSNLARALCDLAFIEAQANEVDRCLELQAAGLAAAKAVQNLRERLVLAQSLACNLLVIGRGEEARLLLDEMIPDMLGLQEPVLLMVFAEDYAAALAEVGDGERAARLLGAAEAMRTRNGNSRHRTQDEQVDQTKAQLQSSSPDTWRDEYDVGQQAAVEEVLASLHAELHVHH